MFCSNRVHSLGWKRPKGHLDHSFCTKVFITASDLTAVWKWIYWLKFVVWSGGTLVIHSSLQNKCVLDYRAHVYKPSNYARIDVWFLVMKAYRTCSKVEFGDVHEPRECSTWSLDVCRVTPSVLPLKELTSQQTERKLQTPVGEPPANRNRAKSKWESVLAVLKDLLNTFTN